MVKFLFFLLLSHALFAQTRFAICVCSYNNAPYVAWNLESLLSQDYDQELFHIYYINDMSTDETLEKAKEYVRQQGKEHLVTFIDNTFKRYQLGNYYHCIHDFIEDDAVVVTVDGDDALAHSQVLSYLDNIYSEDEIYLTYGEYIRKNEGRLGHDAPMTEEISKRHSFRKSCDVLSHLRTFYAWLFKKIRKEDLLYEGQFVRIAGDIAMMFPMIEMANGHFRFITDVLYIYNDNNPLSDTMLARQGQIKMGQYFRHLRPYKPLDPVVAHQIRPYITRKLIEVE